MTDLERLNTCFLPLDRRVPSQPCFFRLIGWDRETLALLERFRAQAGKSGVCLTDLPNPTREETDRFYQEAGTRFSPNRALIDRQISLWLGQVRPERRPALSEAVWNTLYLLQKQDVNGNILKNVYTKFMCWLRGPAGRALAGLGEAEPPKVLFQGDVSRHEVLFLRLLHQAGCDVWYLRTPRAAIPVSSSERTMRRRLSRILRLRRPLFPRLLRQPGNSRRARSWA